MKRKRQLIEKQDKFNKRTNTLKYNKNVNNE